METKRDDNFTSFFSFYLNKLKYFFCGQTNKSKKKPNK